jgi:hypothetical protein
MSRMTPYLLAASTILLLGLFWLQVGRVGSYSAGASLTTDRSGTLQLVNSASVITDGNYDTFESPRGTDFQVPTGQTLTIAAWLAGLQTTGADAALEIGHGSTAVSNSASPPTDPIIVFSIPYRTSGGLNGQPLLAEIPAGRYPFVRVTGADYGVSAVGMVR